MTTAATDPTSPREELLDIFAELGLDAQEENETLTSTLTAASGVALAFRFSVEPNAFSARANALDVALNESLFKYYELCNLWNDYRLFPRATTIPQTDAQPTQLLVDAYFSRATRYSRAYLRDAFVVPFLQRGLEFFDSVYATSERDASTIREERAFLTSRRESANEPSVDLNDAREALEEFGWAYNVSNNALVVPITRAEDPERPVYNAFFTSDERLVANAFSRGFERNGAEVDALEFCNRWNALKPKPRARLDAEVGLCVDDSIVARGAERERLAKDFIQAFVLGSGDFFEVASELF